MGIRNEGKRKEGKTGKKRNKKGREKHPQKDNRKKKRGKLPINFVLNIEIKRGKIREKKERR